uniref:Glutathione S-transferase theta n=1 Tax=Lasioderma serricorne TaxID=295660 RepID=A0A2I6SQK2_9COLE|nr:glutathione S-transferase theta [Lasioderma serricorne]
MTRLKFYYDLMSQPCRALYILLKINKIPFEPCLVNLRKGEQYADFFKNQISRFQKVPVLHDKDFKLTENVAILRYLTREFQIDDHWYPKDSKKQARVDEYLEWQHNNTRLNCTLYFIHAYLNPRLMGKEVKPEELAAYKRNMEETLNKIEDLWLGQGTKYLAGDVISYADILAACELEQPRKLHSKE